MTGTQGLRREGTSPESFLRGKKGKEGKEKGTIRSTPTKYSFSLTVEKKETQKRCRKKRGGRETRHEKRKEKEKEKGVFCFLYAIQKPEKKKRIVSAPSSRGRGKSRRGRSFSGVWIPGREKHEKQGRGKGKKKRTPRARAPFSSAIERGKGECDCPPLLPSAREKTKKSMRNRLTSFSQRKKRKRGKERPVITVRFPRGCRFLRKKG